MLPIPRTVSLDEAAKLVQEHLALQSEDGQLVIFQEAAAGNRSAVKKSKDIIKDVLEQKMLTVLGFEDVCSAAEAIFRRVWGLDTLEPLYLDPEVDEIRVLCSGKVFISRKGKNQPAAVRLNPNDISRLIERMIPYNESGVCLNEGSPMLELVRSDGSRLTALCSPVVKGHAFVLRKHGTIEMTPESLIKLQTLDDKVWRVLSLLVRGRRNILISGGTNSGKTTLLKMLIGELNPALAIRILDTDNEIRATELYPDRDIIEMEAHPEVHADMKEVFEKILRLSPDVIVVGEFRGYGEAVEAIRACTRGHNGSIATTHFSSPQEAIRGTAMLMLEEGLNLSLKLAMARVAQAFNIVVQMFADSQKGVKKITSVTEIEEDDGAVRYRELVRWEPDSPDDYLGPGKWRILSKPGDRACEAMNKHGVSIGEIEEVFTD
ncbi:MAG: pilus assembly protein CpaF [Thermacetogenium sp.]|nr:pilus assembly protein CpaF [Thermacetogenium sp.]